MPPTEAIRHAENFAKYSGNIHTGKIDYEQFLSEYVRMKLFAVTRDIKRNFSALDKNHDNSISKQELLKALVKCLGRQSANAEVDGLFVEMDADGNGKITLNELTRWYQHKVQFISTLQFSLSSITL